MPRGCPKKRARNISGLRNQHPRADVQSSTSATLAPVKLDEPDIDSGSVDVINALPTDHNQPQLSIDDHQATEDPDIGDSVLKESLEEEFDGDDGTDTDFGNPLKAKKVNAKQKERPKSYAKGPDVRSKSQRTQTRYRKSWKNQTSLDNFVKSQPGSLKRTAGEIDLCSDSDDQVEVVSCNNASSSRHKSSVAGSSVADDM